MRWTGSCHPLSDHNELPLTALNATYSCHQGGDWASEVQGPSDSKYLVTARLGFLSSSWLSVAPLSGPWGSLLYSLHTLPHTVSSSRLTVAGYLHARPRSPFKSCHWINSDPPRIISTFINSKLNNLEPLLHCHIRKVYHRCNMNHRSRVSGPISRWGSIAASYLWYLPCVLAHAGCYCWKTK